MSKKKKEFEYYVEPLVMHSFDLNSLDKLSKEIEKFKYSSDEGRCDYDSIIIKFFDNGEIIIEGDFYFHNKSNIII